MRWLPPLVAATLFTACAPDSDDLGSADVDIVAEAPTATFQPTTSCETEKHGYEYRAEIDLSDRDKPKYRIGHTPGIDEYLTEQAMRISLRDGTVWKSKELISRSPGLWGFTEESNPWMPLVLPKDFLDKAFQVGNDGRYNLDTWEVVMNIPKRTDPRCGASFYP